MSTKRENEIHPLAVEGMQQTTRALAAMAWLNSPSGGFNSLHCNFISGKEAYTVTTYSPFTAETRTAHGASVEEAISNAKSLDGAGA